MMRTFFVWHRETPDFLGTATRAYPAVLAAFPTGFTLVARVDSDHQGGVFQLTNHIDAAWWTNVGVKKLVPQAVRSTSVGDVIVEVFEDGKRGETVSARGDARWLVDGIGLQEF